MKEESSEMHSDGDKNPSEKNKKRTVKTRAQIEALEKFYDEHKYPTEAMKMQVAESIGLTEKQVSGWFCHRRLKDKKSMNVESYVTGKQDRSSAVVHDHKQDSCGSTKQVDNRNFDTREAESGCFTPKEVSATDLTYEHGSRYTENYNRTNNPSSGSTSSLPNMSNHQNEDPLDVSTSSYMAPKFAPHLTGVKRPGPSGYLKVKGRVENPAITAVKRQLGKHYQEDGPPLGVQFDPLPPGAFESSMHDAGEETYCTGEAALPALDDVTKTLRSPKLSNAYEYNSASASYPPHINGNNYQMRFGCDIPDSYIRQRFRPRTSLPESSPYCTNRNSLIELPEVPERNEYRMKPRPGVEASRIDSIPACPRLQPYNGIVKEEREESWCRKYNDGSAKVPVREKIENEYPNLSMKRKEFRDSGDQGQSGRVIKDGKIYSDRKIIDENGVNIPFNYNLSAPKRVKEEFPLRQRRTVPSAFDNPRQTYRGVRSMATTQMSSSFSEDEESAETSSSLD